MCNNANRASIAITDTEATEEQGEIRRIAGRRNGYREESASRQHRRRGEQRKRFCGIHGRTGDAAFACEAPETDDDK